MCLRTTAVRPYQKWSWAGDRIVEKPLIPNARMLPAITGRRPGYTRKKFDVDARQFLSIEDDTVIQTELLAMIDALKPEEQLVFGSRLRGAFDFRTRQVLQYLEGRLKYYPSGKTFDPWLFPGETFARGGGDCEDLAFALYGMLRAAGISDYCLRVVFGRVKQENRALGRKEWDHAWVVYKDEAGAWRILEPMALSARPAKFRKKLTRRELLRKSEEIADVEYVPTFVLNAHHLWNVRGPEEGPGRKFPDYLNGRKFWDEFSPGFAASVHDGIYDDALPNIPADALKAIKSLSFWVDVEILSYDPRDHFDFSFVDEGWTRVNRRLASGKFEDLALALHAVGDFYSHTLYGKYATPRADGSIPPYGSGPAIDPALLVYDFKRFSPLPHCSHSLGDAQEYWKGKLISGQWWRWYTTYPDDLEEAKDFKRHFCIPDHDLLAVDSPNWPSRKHYFSDPAEYARQFKIRRAAAVEHIAQIYGKWEGDHGDPKVPPNVLGPQHK